MPNQVVVAGAIIRSGTVLVAQRNRPPELAGRWELPGGKVADGETEQGALVRELAEELGVAVAVGDRLGQDVALGETTVLRAYRVTLLDGEPHPAITRRCAGWRPRTWTVSTGCPPTVAGFRTWWPRCSASPPGPDAGTLTLQ